MWLGGKRTRDGHRLTSRCPDCSSSLVLLDEPAAAALPWTSPPPCWWSPLWHGDGSPGDGKKTKTRIKMCLSPRSDVWRMQWPQLFGHVTQALHRETAPDSSNSTLPFIPTEQHKTISVSFFAFIKITNKWANPESCPLPTQRKTN